MSRTDLRQYEANMRNEDRSHIRNIMDYKIHLEIKLKSLELPKYPRYHLGRDSLR